MINNEFLKQVYQLRGEIENGEATWRDMSDLRERYGENPFTTEFFKKMVWCF